MDIRSLAKNEINTVASLAYRGEKIVPITQRQSFKSKKHISCFIVNNKLFSKVGQA